MIKKDYQKPTTKVVQLQHHGIICTSDPKELSGDSKNWRDLE